MISEKIKKSCKIILEILFYKNRWIVFSVVTLISFFALYKLTLASVANQDLSIFIMMSGVNYTFLSLIILGIISILFGIYLTLFYHKICLIKKASKTGFFGSFGMTIGLFSVGCPTCGAVLFGLLGMPLALMYFPFKGLELKILSIMILLVSIYFISGSLVRCEGNKCAVKQQNI